jgi:hypothetical protein
MASSKLDSEFNEILLETYFNEEVMYHFDQSPELTTTLIETIRVLSHHLVAKPRPWPQNHHDEIDSMERARSVDVNVPAHTPCSTFFSRRGSSHCHGTYTWRRDPGAVMATSWNMGYYPHCHQLCSQRAHQSSHSKLLVAI